MDGRKKDEKKMDKAYKPGRNEWDSPQVAVRVQMASSIGIARYRLDAEHAKRGGACERLIKC